jgi:hypothetical protein
MATAAAGGGCTVTLAEPVREGSAALVATTWKVRVALAGNSQQDRNEDSASA